MYLFCILLSVCRKWNVTWQMVRRRRREAGRGGGGEVKVWKQNRGVFREEEEEEGKGGKRWRQK